jgi:hypothetical protein
MTYPTSLIWFRRLLVLGAVVAGATATTAGAVGRPPDVQDTADANLAALISRPPDVRDVASGRTTAAPDVFERYAAAHPYGTGLSLNETAVIRPPDVQDVAASMQPAPSGSTFVSRPPDVTDASLAVQYRPADQPSGFRWGDWAIGIGTGLGLAILVGAGLVVTRRQLHHRAQTV